ncbi:MAG TPA: SRPBCC family protein [Candidatus Methylacidiphilales bacterium]
MTRKPQGRELHITRFYDAPVGAVWDAWTDPAQVAQWWGPRGFTLTTHGKDLRPGGFWSYTMHGPDGTDYPNRTIYHEVEERAKLVYDHGGGDDRPPLFRVTALFSEVDGRTKLELTMALATPEAAAEIEQFIRKAGGNGTWDRLAEYLEKNASGTEAFVINRTFEASAEVVFDLWTDPEHLARWLAPQGMTMTFLEADIRAGGKTSYKMGNELLTMYGRASYRQVERPRLLVYTQQFCDKDGNVSRHPLAPTWPETMLTTVTFREIAPDRTLVTVHWEVEGATTPEEMATFTTNRGNMTGGWTGSFDQFEAYLAQRA